MRYTVWLLIGIGLFSCAMGGEAEPATKQGKVGQTLTNSMGMKLTFIPAGEFERTLRGEEQKFVIKPFMMGTTEVTQKQWKQVMGNDNNPSLKKGDTLPVEKVLWTEAVAFCKKLSEKEGRTYRLPTDAEWEYACRAGTKTPFHTGETISTDQANYNGDYVYGTGKKGVYRCKSTPVGSFKPNTWGLYDMHGNVCEWCSDLYEEGSPHRVYKGGSWGSMPDDCTSFCRNKALPNGRRIDIGFRLLLEIP